MTNLLIIVLISVFLIFWSIRYRKILCKQKRKDFEMNNLGCPFSVHQIENGLFGDEVVSSCCSLVMGKKCSEKICPLLKVKAES